MTVLSKQFENVTSPNYQGLIDYVNNLYDEVITLKEMLLISDSPIDFKRLLDQYTTKVIIYTSKIYKLDLLREEFPDRLKENK